MKDFEDIVSGLMPEGFKFDWGTSEDLPRFIRIHGEKHFPFMWSVPGRDSQDEWGWWTRDAEINICTRETRDLSNKDRKSFETILYPAWDDLVSNMLGSENIELIDGSVSFQKYPEFSGGGNEAQEKWDVLKVRFKARFYNDYSC